MASQTSPKLGTNIDNEEIEFVKRGCCFWIPCFRSDRRSDLRLWDRIPTSAKENDDGAVAHWLVKPVVKIREWSELVAGPKWKTFIRRFNKGRLTKNGKFQYDPFGYALNFDEGPGEDYNLDDDRMSRSFSFRFAAIPVTAKSSTELVKDVQTLT